MILNTIKIEGQVLTVYVDEDGKFSTTWNGDRHEADELERLKGSVRSAIIATRYEIPFVLAQDGRRGIIRGYHAGNHDFLVTWADGTKARMGTSEQVFPPEDLTDAQVEEMADLDARGHEIHQRKLEIRSGARYARELFQQQIAPDFEPERGSIKFADPGEVLDWPEREKAATGFGAD